MSARSTAASPISTAATVTAAAALRHELAQATAVLDRLIDDYDELLADPDAIQEDRDAAAQLLEDGRRHLAELQAAEARLAEGTYGRCVVCGRTIDPERLAALPDAGTCVGCS